MRIWSLDEANGALPEVRVLLAEARAVWSDLGDAKRNIEDLRIVWAEAVQDPACPDHPDWLHWLARFQRDKARLDEVVARFEERGIVLKDVEAGLVDFWAMRGDEPVFLCWREEESTVSSWHPLDGGFAARLPVPDLDV